ncbi:hypothetical protein [Oceanobacillus profundus]|uniref:Uncharacterized protein n=1 Tax=Oceanobacillus profundus TaxID=372463 RepID=A0A417YGE3_9BACI|nr:hypothetical protein [Oceanobacillus profundus]RHW31887.1 hypothetical protein D1B32_11655 [Oceanobacillus profundus]
MNHLIIFPEIYITEVLETYLSAIEKSHSTKSIVRNNGLVAVKSGYLTNTFPVFLKKNNIPFDYHKTINGASLIQYSRKDFDKAIYCNHVGEHLLRVNDIHDIVTDFANGIGSNTAESALISIAKLVRENDPVKSGRIKDISEYTKGE